MLGRFLLVAAGLAALALIALLSNVNTAPVGGRAYRRIAAAFLAAADGARP